MFGYTAEQALGQPSATLLAHKSAQSYECAMAAALTGERIEPFETTLLHADRCLVEVSLSLSPMRSAARDEIEGVSVSARDNTERKRLERQLRHLADHDPLTGLYNRRRFDEELGRAMANARRYDEGACVLLIDIDDFKYVNDTIGHGAGDELLRSLAGMIQQRVRATDVLARIGGDEFALLLPRALADEARLVAADLVQAARDHVLALGIGLVHVTVSVGAVAFDATAGTGENVLIAADRAMYEAKAQGRDRYVVLSDVATVAGRPQVPWEQRIRGALENDGFVLHCQPILGLAGSDVSHYELLLRLRESDGSLTYPGAFLEVAERLGLIHAIDRWVVSQAIELVCAHPDLTFAVNVSGASMDDHDLLALVRRRLSESGADPSRLVFEITETATIARIDDARRFAEAMTSLGCQLAIDDFGTGFGSFFYLKHLPVSYLKIDGDFVANPRSRTDELVIEAIVGMARGLGKHTIAEFVGDDETIAMLTRSAWTTRRATTWGAPSTSRAWAPATSAHRACPPADATRRARSVAINLARTVATCWLRMALHGCHDRRWSERPNRASRACCACRCMYHDRRRFERAGLVVARLLRMPLQRCHDRRRARSSTASQQALDDHGSRQSTGRGRSSVGPRCPSTERSAVAARRTRATVRANTTIVTSPVRSSRRGSPSTSAAGTPRSVSLL